MIFFSVAICSIANRCRGSKFYDRLKSTTLTRIIASNIIALAVSPTLTLQPIISAGLMLWMIPAWDNYWSAAINNPTDTTKKAFLPVDWIMAKIWPSAKPGIQLRLWGTIAMGLRGFICIYPLFVVLGLAGYHAAFLIGLATLLQGIPYFFFGLFGPGRAIPRAEYAWGAILGALFLAVFHA